MATAFFLYDRGKLAKVDDYLVYTTYENQSTKIIPFMAESILIFSSVSITGDAMNLIMKNKIPLTYMTRAGFCNGRVAYCESKNVFLRQNQYAMLADGARRLAVSKAIAGGKIRNQIAFAQRIKRTRKNQTELDDAVQKLKQALQEVADCGTLDALRGIEGNASKYYFSVLRYNILPEWAEFTKRSKNPPESNVNALLSFLYTLTAQNVQTILESLGLDTMAGCFHEQAYGHSALTFDLVEEFRVPVADTLACRLLNKGILAEADFYQPDESQPAVYLTKEGMGKVLGCFCEKMESRVLYAPLNKKLSFREIMIEQAKLYRNTVEEKGEYSSFVFK